jgi:hypothetical protein
MAECGRRMMSGFYARRFKNGMGKNTFGVSSFLQIMEKNYIKNV